MGYFQVRYDFRVVNYNRRGLKDWPLITLVARQKKENFITERTEEMKRKSVNRHLCLLM